MDWINDKLYWVDSDPSEIGVYDLRTGLQHAVLSIVDSIGPCHILVYPYPDYGCVWFIYKHNYYHTVRISKKSKS